ncbi:hypothetical protein GC176_07190 [bacterium]|nr:hypothetical protein [bacterium]
MQTPCVERAGEIVNKPQRQKLYTAIWRWHFYAGLLSIPICMFLGTTGAIYLFKPYVEPLLYCDLQTVAVGSEKLSLEQQLEAARAARPDAKAASLTPGTGCHVRVRRTVDRLPLKHAWRPSGLRSELETWANCSRSGCRSTFSFRELWRIPTQERVSY